jgi:hypothetical protein
VDTIREKVGMSLVSELRMPRSPITQYIKFVGAIVADSGQGPLADGFQKLLDLDTIPKGITLEPLAGANPARTGRE